MRRKKKTAPLISVEEYKRRLILEALQRCKGNVSEAARYLNCSRTTIRKYKGAP